MASARERLAVDSSVVLKWRMPSEPQAAEAHELLLDWQHPAIEVCAPGLLQAEITSAFLRALRRGRISEADAIDGVRQLLGLPFQFHETTALQGIRALAIARQYNQGAFDCTYVALAEQEAVEFWTGDQRLYNALHADFPFVRFIGDYQRKRP